MAKDLKGTSKYNQLYPLLLSSKPSTSLVWIIAQSPNWSTQSCQSDLFICKSDFLIKIPSLLTTKCTIKSTTQMKAYLVFSVLLAFSSSQTYIQPFLLVNCTWTMLGFFLFPDLARLTTTLVPFAKAFFGSKSYYQGINSNVILKNIPQSYLALSSMFLLPSYHLTLSDNSQFLSTCYNLSSTRVRSCLACDNYTRA